VLVVVVVVVVVVVDTIVCRYVVFSFLGGVLYRLHPSLAVHVSQFSRKLHARLVSVSTHSRFNEPPENWNNRWD